MPPKTLYQKSGIRHLVHEEPGQPCVIYIDRHLIHEGTSPQAFAGFARRRPQSSPPRSYLRVMDHSVSTTDRTLPILDQDAKLQFDALEQQLPRIWRAPLRHAQQKTRASCTFIGPELGITQPARPLSAATATLPRMEHSAPSLSASAPAKWNMCLRPSGPGGSRARKPCTS